MILVCLKPLVLPLLHPSHLFCSHSCSFPPHFLPHSLFSFSHSKPRTNQKKKQKTHPVHTHNQQQLVGTWAAVAAPHFIPSHSKNIDIVYVFRFSVISSFCFSFIQMNNITRTRNRGKEGVFGGEFGRTFSCIFIKNTIEKHPENFMVLGVPVSPFILSHQNHPICTFQNHRMWSDILVFIRTRWWRWACRRGRRGPGSRP